MKNLKLLGIALAFMSGLFFGSFTGNPVAAAATGLVFVGCYAAKTILSDLQPGVALFTALDLTELASELGAYHREHRDELASELLLDEDFTQDLEVMDDVTDEVPLPNLAITDLIKPADPVNFTPTANALAFGARKLKVRGIKVDLLIVPQLLEKTWLGKMKKSSDPMDLPFEKFIMDYINSKIRENLRLKAIYGGVYASAGTTPEDTMDGFLTIIDNEITATNITEIVTGSITAANVITNLEKVYDGLGEAYKGVPTIMKVNPQIFDWYNRKYRTDFGANQNYDGMKKGRITLDGTSCEVVREPGLGTSQRVIASPKENFLYGVDTASGYNLDVQKFNRSLKILIDLKAGVEFTQIHSRCLAVNDQV